MTTTAEPRTTAPAVPRKPSFWSQMFERWPVKLVVLAIVIIWLIPSFGLLISSIRTPEAIDTSGWWSVFPNLWDETWTLENYRNVLTSEGFGNAFLNTLAVTIPATVIPISVAAFAAYAFAWMKFPGRQVTFVVVIGLLVVPLQMALIPILRLYTSGGHVATWVLVVVLGLLTLAAGYFLVRGRGGVIPIIVLGVLTLIALGFWIGGTDIVTIFPDLDLNGTFLAVWIAHTGFGLPLAIYLLRNYMGSLPSSLIESAEIDGATHFQIFTRLIVPLSVPVLASFAIFQFLWVWNDFLVALVFLGTDADVEVLTIALSELKGGRGEAFHLLTAGAFISMVLPLAVFFALQRFFVRGLTAGSVKG